MNEWTWWDGAFALKLIWHGIIIGGAIAIVVGGFAFRWAWRRGVKITQERDDILKRAEAKLAEERAKALH